MSRHGRAAADRLQPLALDVADDQARPELRHRDVVQVPTDQGRAGRRLVVRGEGHAADLGGQRSQDRVLDPLADRDQRALPARADHGDEHGQDAGHDHRAEVISLVGGADRPGDPRHQGAQRERDAGRQRGQPAVAPRTGQQRPHRQRTGQIEARPYRNPRNSNYDVQHESDRDPNGLTAQAPRRTPQ
jgi:hypothetical protein